MPAEAIPKELTKEDAKKKDEFVKFDVPLAAAAAAATAAAANPNGPTAEYPFEKTEYTDARQQPPASNRKMQNIRESCELEDVELGVPEIGERENCCSSSNASADTNESSSDEGCFSSNIPQSPAQEQLSAPEQDEEAQEQVMEFKEELVPAKQPSSNEGCCSSNNPSRGYCTMENRHEAASQFRSAGEDFFDCYCDSNGCICNGCEANCGSPPKQDEEAQEYLTDESVPTSQTSSNEGCCSSNNLNSTGHGGCSSNSNNNLRSAGHGCCNSSSSTNNHQSAGHGCCTSNSTQTNRRKTASQVRSAGEAFFDCYCDSNGCICNSCDGDCNESCGCSSEQDEEAQEELTEIEEELVPAEPPSVAKKCPIQKILDYFFGFLGHNFSIIIAMIAILVVKSKVDGSISREGGMLNYAGGGMSSHGGGMSSNGGGMSSNGGGMSSNGGGMSSNGGGMRQLQSNHEQHEHSSGEMEMVRLLQMPMPDMFRDHYITPDKPFETNSLAGPITIMAVLVIFLLLAMTKRCYALMEKPVKKTPTKRDNGRFWLFQEMSFMHYLAALTISVALIVEGIYHYNDRMAHSMMTGEKKHWIAVSRTLAKVGTDLWSIAILTSVRRFGLAHTFGQNHEFYLRFHIIAGSIGIALVALHGIIFAAFYGNCGELSFVKAGIIATSFGGATWMVATAIKPYLDRNRYLIGGYDIFRLSHYLMVAAVGLAGYHIWKADISMCGKPTLTSIFYIAVSSYAGLVYAIELFAGWFSLVKEMRVVDEDRQHVYLKIRVNPLSFYSRSGRPLNFKPGQYCLIWCPTISLASHPFTICWSDDPRYITLLIKKSGRFTEKLIDIASKEKARLPIWINGPFGSGAGHAARKRVRICIAAGVGCTPMPSIIAGYNKPIEEEECYFFYTFRSGNLYRELRPTIKDLPYENCMFVCTNKKETFSVEDAPEGGENDVIIRERTNVAEWLATIKEKVGGDGHDVAIFYCGPDVLKAQIWGYTLNHWSKAELRLETFDMLPKEVVSWFGCPMKGNRYSA